MTKVSVYVDDGVWRAFKEAVFKKYGNRRSINKEVNNLLRAQLVEEQVISGFVKIGVKVNGSISSREIQENRPKLKGPSSAEIIREMRSNRLA